MKERDERQINAQRHNANLQRPEDEDKAPETLKYISQPEESVESPAGSLEWINTKSASTANLTDEDVRSKDWIIEYHQLMSRMRHPPSYGLTGHIRAWAYDDPHEELYPLSGEDLLTTEGFAEIGRESSTRSRGGWATETSTRDTKESIVHDGQENKGLRDYLSL